MVHEFEEEHWSGGDQPVVYRHEAALKLIPQDATSLLDIGCGDGLLLSLAAERVSGTCTGVDFSDTAVAKAKEKVAACSFKTADITKRLPFDDTSFETVVALDVCEHLYFPNRLMNEMARVSSKYVIIGVPNFSSLPARLQVLRGRVPENNTPKRGHLYWFNYAVLCNMIQGAGLEVDELLMNYPWETKPLIGPIIKRAGTALPNLFALSFVVRAKKREA